MSVLRKRLREGFTVIPNELLEDPDLRLATKGLVAWMLSKPDGWAFSAERLAREGPEGRDAIRACLSEAEGHGWILRRRFRTETGQVRSEILVRNSLQIPWDSVGPTDVGSTDVGSTERRSARRLSKDLEVRTDEQELKVQTLAPAAQERAPDPLWDVLEELYGIAPKHQGWRGGWNAAAKELRQQEAEPERIRERVLAARSRKDEAWKVATPQALAKHWGLPIGTTTPGLRSAVLAARLREEER